MLPPTPRIVSSQPLARLASLRITHKGLALVLIPLFLETIWILLLCQLWLSTENLANQETKQREFAMHLSRVTESRLVMIAEMMSHMFDTSRDWAWYASIDHRKLQEHYKILRTMSADDARSLQTISELESMSQKEWQGVSALPQAEQGTTMMENLTASRGLIVPLLRLGVIDGERIAVLTRQENQNLAATREKEFAARAKLKTLVYAGLTGNLLVAALLLYLFNKDITGRLNLLVENARRLPSRQISLQTVAGSDELAYLDAALHEASAQLVSAEEHRRSVMEMVAHDMRSPLMAAQISTEILTEHHAQSLLADTRQMLELVRRHVNKVLKLVNELLTVERFEAGKAEFELTKFAVREAVDEAISMSKELVGIENLSIRNDCGDGFIRADKEKFEQVVINFITSVRSFPGSAKEIVVRSDFKSNAVLLSVSAAGASSGSGAKSFSL